MTEYSRMAKGNFVSTGMAQIINLPFQPDYVEIINSTAAATPAGDGVPFAWWDANMGQGTAVEEIFTDFGTTPDVIALTTDTVVANGISTFAAGQLLQFGAVQNVSTLAKATSIVTASAAHGLASGDVVIFSNLYQSATTGMIQICDVAFTVTVTAPTTFTIPFNLNQSNYTDYNSGSLGTGGVQATFKKVLYPYLYAPGVSVIGAITRGSTTTVTTTNAHNFVAGQEVAFRVPAAWGTTQLNSLPNVSTPGSPVYGYVISVTDYHTFVVNINSSAYTAFNSNQPFIGTSGRTFAQVVAVGDVNTGGVQISAGSPLYPSPYIVPIGTTRVSTINGPAIQGAYINNTAQGFIIGAGAGTNDSSSVLVGGSGNIIYWKAYLHDMNLQTTAIFP